MGGLLRQATVEDNWTELRKCGRGKGIVLTPISRGVLELLFLISHRKWSLARHDLVSHITETLTPGRGELWRPDCLGSRASYPH